MSSPTTHEDDPGLDGPDYVTLVIEWNDNTDVTTFAGAEEPDRAPSSGRTIAKVLGALAAIAFAMWGIRHLRTS
jgi:hypothetical protein